MGPRQIVSIVQAAVFLAAGVVFISIRKIGATWGMVKEPKEPREASKDWGIFYLAMACFLWSIMGGLQYFQVEDTETFSRYNLFRTLLSTMNTAFIVGVLCSLEVYEKSVAHLQEKWFPKSSLQGAIRNFMWICGIIGFVALMVGSEKYQNLVDIVISAVVLWYALKGLYKSFKQQNFLLAWLSVVVLSLYIIVEFTELSVLAKFFNAHQLLECIRWAANLSFKTMLSLLFLALFVSWIRDRAEQECARMSGNVRAELSRARRFLKVNAPYQGPKDDEIVFEIQCGYSIDGIQTVHLNEKGYLRLLEIALKWQQTKQPIQTRELYHKNDQKPDPTNEVRADLKDVLGATRIDPIFRKAASGIRHPYFDPADIELDLEAILAWSSWENIEFAKFILDPLRPEWDLQGAMEKK